MPPLLIPIAMLACGAGALFGCYLLLHPQDGAAWAGLSPAPGGSTAGVRAFGGALLLSHATVLAALSQAPAIGSCLAAGLGSAWLGGAAGRALGAVLERRRGRPVLLRIGFEALVGIALWAPLWTYLRLLREGAGVSV